MNGAGGDLEHEALFVGLAEKVRDLADGRALTVAQFATDGMVIWDVRRDEAGTPRCRYWPPVPWPDLRDESGPSEGKMIRVIAWPEDGSRMVFVCSAPADPYAEQAYEIAVNAHGRAPAFCFTGPLDEMLRQVIAAEPLTQWYELVTLRRTQSGRLVFTGTQLFPPGARRGERQSFTVRCEPGGEDGTVFAVVATESVDQIRLVSLDSVNLAPGAYNLTAVLRRPGLVRFEGLPAKLREDHRRWTEIVTSVPDRLDFSQPGHLICAIEVSGPDWLVEERIELADQFIRHVATAAEGRLKVSLISYGPHAVGLMFSEEPARLLAWAQDRSSALHELDRLKERGAAPTGYPRAAQLECVLDLVVGELNRREQDNGRPVLVTIGSRPAFPYRLDPVTEIIPCPKRHDWRRDLQRLQNDHPGIAFGAISDRLAEDEIWPHLANDGYARINSTVFDTQGFAESLGLLSKIEYIPFPLIEPEEAEHRGH